MSLVIMIRASLHLSGRREDNNGQGRQTVVVVIVVLRLL